MSDITTTERRILDVLCGRPLDYYDLSDAVGLTPQSTFERCVSLRSKGFVEWLYVEDEVAISDAGKRAISGAPNA